ncbi:hypothetical protein [Leptolyngbya sp. NIES-2104]|nr:hypothetical protein [Leptolyngbya sp. NIES-2104]GAP93650.1 hypothetical protein NIES2104_01570 [Leptolyngbya sp. NIES-2104]
MLRSRGSNSVLRSRFPVAYFRSHEMRRAIALIQDALGFHAGEVVL